MRKPFGDRPGEQDTLDYMRKLASKGMNYMAIAQELKGPRVPLVFAKCKARPICLTQWQASR